jgi:hypothetical protein
LNVFKSKLREKRAEFYFKTASEEIPILKLEQEGQQQNKAEQQRLKTFFQERSR